MQKHKEYIERSDLKDATHLEVSVYYTKGGANYFSGGTTQRGYYLSVTPVTKSERSVSFTMFSGFKHLLLETQRYTDKQFNRAVDMAKDHRESLIAKVVEQSKAA